MPGAYRRRAAGINIWPGFVDALASLLLVIIFLLLVFVLTQFYLGEVLSGRNKTIHQLSLQLNQLTDQLDLERKANDELKVNIGHLNDSLVAANQANAQQKAQSSQQIALLQNDVDALNALKAELEKEVAALGAKANEAQGQLKQEQNLSATARAQAALLNQQLEAMRQEMARISAALAASESADAAQKVQLADLGKRLNAALAGKVEELSRYRSEFFGRLSQLLGGNPGIRIEGDRFVFQSELLFPSGSADLGDTGRLRLGELAQTLKDVTKTIPPDINWLLRVDGHTDKVPIKTVQFASNWELSTARAVSVVKYLVAQGIPAERLAAAGFGEFQPIDKGDTPGALAKNRRIEIRLDQR
jgi:chemotaxis protein MotB